MNFNNGLTYEQFLMALSQENKYRRLFFQRCCERHPEDIIIMKWRGRSEEAWNSGKPRLSFFSAEFDIARAYRTEDCKTSPILVGYELKGTGKREKSKEKYAPPVGYEGIGQASYYLKQDADYVYIVRPRLKKAYEEEILIETIKDNPHLGLIWVELVNGKPEFTKEFDPSSLNPKINLDRKKANLFMACICKQGHDIHIQKQTWARKHNFVLKAQDCG